MSVDMDFSGAELQTKTVRPAYAITSAGTNLTLRQDLFKRMKGAYDVSGSVEAGSYPIVYKGQRGTAGASRKVVFEFPYRVAFRPEFVRDANDTTLNMKRVLSSVGPAVINAEGNLEQEFFINDSNLSLWAAGTRMTVNNVNLLPRLI